MWRPSFTQILWPTYPCYPASSKSIKSPSLPLSFCLSPKVIAPAGRKPMTISSYNRNGYMATSLVIKTLTWRLNMKVSVEAPKLAPKPTFEAIQVTHRLISSYAPVGCWSCEITVPRYIQWWSIIHYHLLQLYISSLFIWKCHQYLNKTPNINKVNNTTQRWNSKGQVSLLPHISCYTLHQLPSIQSLHLLPCKVIPSLHTTSLGPWTEIQEFAHGWTKGPTTGRRV